MTITGNLQQQVKTLLPQLSKLSFTISDQESCISLDFSPGQQVTAKVLAILPDSQAQVQIGSHRLNLELPVAVQTGQVLEMTYISRSPRPTFALTLQGSDTPPVNLSETSRLLGLLAECETVNARTAIQQTLLEGPPENTEHTAHMLRQGLQISGLFYESHLARWFNGEYPLEELLKEPQGQMSRLAKKQPDISQTSQHVADQRTIPLVQEQLSALQNGQVLFRGSLFPGQNLEWSVEERDARHDEQAGQERSWGTSLTIELPRLGVINARLTLAGTRVGIDIRAAESESAEMLGNGLAGLKEHMETAGLVPGEIEVRHDTPK